MEEEIKEMEARNFCTKYVGFNWPLTPQASGEEECRALVMTGSGTSS
jgi:hypothetical protein